MPISVRKSCRLSVTTPAGVRSRSTGSSGARRRLFDLDADRRERGAELAQRLVAEVVLELERLELVGAHRAALLGIRQEAGDRVVRDLVVQGVGAQGGTLLHVPPN